MGLFDFFKKENNEVTRNELFLSISKYNAYIVQFMNMQQRGNYSPISAYEDSAGEIIGLVYVMEDDNSYTLSVQEVISRMEISYEQKLAKNKIKSYVILYHSQFDNEAV
jgi:hypothetical protein